MKNQVSQELVWHRLYHGNSKDSGRTTKGLPPPDRDGDDFLIALRIPPYITIGRYDADEEDDVPGFDLGEYIWVNAGGAVTAWAEIPEVPDFDEPDNDCEPDVDEDGYDPYSGSTDYELTM